MQQIVTSVHRLKVQTHQFDIWFSSFFSFLFFFLEYGPLICFTECTAASLLPFFMANWDMIENVFWNQAVALPYAYDASKN